MEKVEQDNKDSAEKEEEHWQSLESRITDFLDEEDVSVMHVSDARYTFSGPLASYRNRAFIK